MVFIATCVFLSQRGLLKMYSVRSCYNSCCCKCPSVSIGSCCTYLRLLHPTFQSTVDPFLPTCTCIAYCDEAQLLHSTANLRHVFAWLFDNSTALWPLNWPFCSLLANDAQTYFVHVLGFRSGLALFTLSQTLRVSCMFMYTICGTLCTAVVQYSMYIHTC